MAKETPKTPGIAVPAAAGPFKTYVWRPALAAGCFMAEQAHRLQALRQEWTSELKALEQDVEAKRRLAAQELSSRAEEETIRASESGFTLLSMLQMDTEDLATAWLIPGCQAMRPVLWSCSQQKLMPACLLAGYLFGNSSGKLSVWVTHSVSC